MGHSAQSFWGHSPITRQPTKNGFNIVIAPPVVIAPPIVIAPPVVIAGLTRNPVLAWQWIPDRVRDDKP
jgi:hypothetical protein